ncbi:hypothetical protein ACF07S_29275 [Streptomyces sp. NPDC016640]|uniref:hypothetical protein n=1 Tax=Streptomyces sp. NPDC016640 TaxID=3364969 RepID=UPI0036F963A0
MAESHTRDAGTGAIRRGPNTKGFTSTPKRWSGEQTFGTALPPHRRPARGYETRQPARHHGSADRRQPAAPGIAAQLTGIPKVSNEEQKLFLQRVLTMHHQHPNHSCLGNRPQLGISNRIGLEQSLLHYRSTHDRTADPRTEAPAPPVSSR